MTFIDPASVPPRIGSGYPEPYRQRSPLREKRALGDAGGLAGFGVNLTTLPPGEWSSQRHWHSLEDEFVWVLDGEVTLVTDAGEQVLRGGQCAAFPAGRPDGHHLINRSDRPARYLEVGGRDPADICTYPDADLHFEGGRYTRKDGTPY